MIALEERPYRTIAAIAEREAGLYMPEAKRAFVASRLQRRLRTHGMTDFRAYAALVGNSDAQGAAERRHLVSALTTNVTDVYREPHHFDGLAVHLRERRGRGAGRGGRLRIWSAGCSTGEEPLSIAAICLHVFGATWTCDTEIIATDVDHAVLDVARTRADLHQLGAALASISGVVTGASNDLRMTPHILTALLRDGITFRHHNLLNDLDLAGQFDVIFCRNVTIYFSGPVQLAVHQRFRARLAPAGLLAIGHSERLLGSEPEVVPAGRTMFRRPVPNCQSGKKANRCR